jgi:hypothetical protein
MANARIQAAEAYLTTINGADATVAADLLLAWIGITPAIGRRRIDETALLDRLRPGKAHAQTTAPNQA